MPFNPRSLATTRECVHLVTLGHFRSRDKDGGHTVWSAIAEKNLMLHANFMAVCFIERELLPMKDLHCGNRNFRPFWSLQGPWLWPDDLPIRTWPVFPGDILDLQIWTSCVKAFAVSQVIIWQTDRTENMFTTPRRFAYGQIIQVGILYRRDIKHGPKLDHNMH